MIRPAIPAEANAISELGIRSKAHWGYSAEQMQVFAEELTLVPADIRLRSVHVLESKGRLIGYYALVPKSTAVMELEHLFVDPAELRRGHGRSLFAHAIDLASQKKYQRLAIQSDPNAEGFYVALDVPLLRRIPSSIPGRSIPYFELEL